MADPKNTIDLKRSAAAAKRDWQSANPNKPSDAYSAGFADGYDCAHNERIDVRDEALAMVSKFQKQCVADQHIDTQEALGIIEELKGMV